MVWDGTTSMHNNWGRNPSLIKPQQISVKIKNNSAGLKVTPLDVIGNPVTSEAKYFVSDENGYSHVSVNTEDDKTVWYAVETVADWTTTGSSGINIKSNGVNYFPNPSADAIYFKPVIPSTEISQLQIFNVTGKLIFTDLSKYEYVVNRDQVGSGMFIFKAMLKNEIVSGKIFFY